MDNAVQSLYRAIEHASPIWQHAVYRLSWSHWLMVSAYGVAAWLCFLNVQAEEEVQGSCTLWWAATVLLCMLGANVVLQADLFVTQTLRAMAKLQDWYGQRRVLQYLVIGLTALLVLLGLNSKICLPKRVLPNAHSRTGAVSAGLLVLLMLFAVRMVSAHGTDAVLNARLLGVSIGRLCELACLAWVMRGALCSLLSPFTNPKPCLVGIDRRV